MRVVDVVVRVFTAGVVLCTVGWFLAMLGLDPISGVVTGWEWVSGNPVLHLPEPPIPF